MTERENYLKAVRFETPEWVPVEFHINGSCWNHFDNEQLQDLMESHKLLFPDFVRIRGAVKPKYLVNQLKDSPWTDPWKCVWETAEDGITGSVHQHPLASWDNFDSYEAPSPLETDGTYLINWDEIKKGVEAKKAAGKLVVGGLPHGHTFLRLQDIRGYENLIFDMVDEDPRLDKLVGMLSDFNYQYVQKWLELEPDVMTYPEDLGMQIGPMLSPDQFRRYIKPGYQRSMKPSRDKGVAVHMHSDGDIRDLVDDLIDGGVEVINLQDLVNGIDWIAAKFSGKVCVDLDVDRQDITRNGSPEMIDALIKEEVQKIGTPQGGLTMIYGLYPGVPIENVSALMDAFEKYMVCYS